MIGQSAHQRDRQVHSCHPPNACDLQTNFSHSYNYYYPSLLLLFIILLLSKRFNRTMGDHNVNKCQMPRGQRKENAVECAIDSARHRNKDFIALLFLMDTAVRPESIVISPMKTNCRLRSDSWMAVTASESSGDSTSLSSIFSSSSSSLLLDYYHYIILMIRGRRIRTRSLQREHSVFNVL